MLMFSQKRTFTSYDPYIRPSTLADMTLRLLPQATRSSKRGARVFRICVEG